jgi:CubicO group peptidase (beta-lactamase class C family)
MIRAARPLKPRGPDRSEVRPPRRRGRARSAASRSKRPKIDALSVVSSALRPFHTRCRVPRDLESVTDVGAEIRPRDVGTSAAAVRRVWARVEAVYRTGLYPAIQICIRRRGGMVLNRAIGHASGNAPGDLGGASKVPIETDTPFTLYSASKAITAMVIHKLDEQNLIRLDDRICDYVPEFGGNGKQWITIRHVLGHRAGIPNVPAEAMDLDLLEHPEEILRILCEAKILSRPGRRLAYHAVTGGFVLAEVVRRVTGRDIRDVLRTEIQEPLGLRYTNYGVAPEDVPRVVADAFTGFPVLPPLSTILRRALGVDMARVIEFSTDSRFLTGIVPSANIVSTAEELAVFYDCLLHGEGNGAQVFDPRTVRRATLEQAYWEIDLTLGLPLRYGLGFMLGGYSVGLFGPDTPRAFGHIGFTNILSWADPERELAVAILTSGKPILSPEMLRLYQLLMEIGRAFPKR